MVGALAAVHEARIGSGTGMLDFAPDLEEIRPDVFIVNEDGDTAAKSDLCARMGVEYVVLPRTPAEGLPERSSSGLKAEAARDLPYRLCLAGGWLDQPWVSQLHPGSVITCQIAPRADFLARAGLATSSRRVWAHLEAQHELGGGADELARLLFRYENPPGTPYVSGSQDAIGLAFSGINRLEYRGSHWPDTITRILDTDTHRWLEQHLVLVPIGPRPAGYSPLTKQNPDAGVVAALARSADLAWQGIEDHDLEAVGRGLTGTHDAWRELLPHTTTPDIDELLTHLRKTGAGATTTGAGGGYAIVATDQEPEDVAADAFRIRIT